MKTTTFTSVLLLAIIFLSACSGSQAVSTENESQGLLNTDYENAMPVELQLALGMLSLESTGNAVSAETAAELLPLWKAVRSLSESDSVAAEEIQALYRQIQETMTAEQIQEITAMQLTSDDMAQVAEELGLDFFGGGRFGELSPELQATAQAAREGGELPQGGFPGGSPGGGAGGGQGIPGSGPGGGGGFPGGQLSPEQQATIEARRAAGGGGNRSRIPAAVLNAVIEYLETKTQ